MKKSRRRARRRHLRLGLIVFVIALVAAYCAIDLLRPLPPVIAETQPILTNSNDPLSAAWPNSEESSVGVQGYGVIATNGSQQEIPTASIAKLATALSVLSKEPLALGEPGPTITINPSAVADYEKYVGEDGSVVEVTLGEQLTEYQALQAMLLPSANNMADTLANWAFGSIQNYTTYANKLVSSYGMHHTTISDASGFSPATVSTSNDLIILGEEALNNPVIAQIVNQPTAVLPVVGEVRNVNLLLGTNDIIGIKTGNTDQAGGTFLSAARYTLPNQQTMTVIASIMKAPTIIDALNETPPLLLSVKSQLSLKKIPAGYTVTKYVSAWGATADGITRTDLTAPYLPGLPVRYAVSSVAISSPKPAGTLVGTAVLGTTGGTSSTGVTLAQKLAGPTIMWRLLHPKYIFD